MPEKESLVSALIKARQSFRPILKDRSNPFHKSQYATLDSVLDSVQEALAEQGLVLIQTIDVINERPILVTTLHHVNGERVDSRYPLPENLDPQKLGAAITYGRRYSVCAILSVTADEDDDGEAAKPSAKDKLLSEVKAEAKRIGWDTDAAKAYLGKYPNYKETITSLSEAELKEVIDYLKTQ